MKKEITTLNSKNITNIVNNYPVKYKEGFTSKEIKSLCKQYDLGETKFHKILGVNTCIMKDGEILTYHCDIDSTLRCMVEDRDKHLWEWD